MGREPRPFVKRAEGAGIADAHDLCAGRHVDVFRAGGREDERARGETSAPAERRGLRIAAPTWQVAPVTRRRGWSYCGGAALR
jgi:hypothetical protein